MLSSVIDSFPNLELQSSKPNIPRIRFKGFTEPWQYSSFSNLAKTIRGLTYSPKHLVDNGVRVLRSSNIDNDRFVLSYDDIFVCEEAINIDYTQENDILITAANGSSHLVGKHCLVSNIDNRSTVHGGFMLIARAKDPYFLNASMSSSWYKNFISRSAAGGKGAIGNLSKSDLDSQRLLVPSIIEQRQIGVFFQNQSTQIENTIHSIEKLRVFKQACLDKMFV